ncbi:hypothetical protein AVEN_115291-1 [Araneus ventricosus]|uniref:Uncharacterized protein n=1 Tax=Araneus ventricosus TaxID=182803 RepID=A0A4Y1ZXX6_ARAVE|nr:hypothetical protein AVEN_115291-1 [Araneus ventricosus]
MHAFPSALSYCPIQFTTRAASALWGVGHLYAVPGSQGALPILLISLFRPINTRSPVAPGKAKKAESLGKGSRHVRLLMWRMFSKHFFILLELKGESFLFSFNSARSRHLCIPNDFHLPFVLGDSL